MIALVYLPGNAAWVFIFGRSGSPRERWSLFRMGDGPMFFQERQEAVQAAQRQGLIVEDDGNVRIPHSGGMLQGLAARRGLRRSWLRPRRGG